MSVEASKSVNAESLVLASERRGPVARQVNSSVRSAKDAVAMELVQAMALGDTAAFAALFAENAPRLKGHLVARGLSDALSETIAIDTMLSAWRDASAFDASVATAAGWLYRLLMEEVRTSGRTLNGLPTNHRVAIPPLSFEQNARDKDYAFLANGGEMGALTRAYNWAQSPIGAPENWPQALKTAVRLMLTSRHPMFIWWGPDLIQFYNDAYRATMGFERHPSALGDRGRDCWAEIWDIIGADIDFVMGGDGATWHEDQLVPVTRHGGREAVWWTYGYSPIDNEDGVGGVLVVCKDVTQEHLQSEWQAGEIDRLRQLFAQAPGFVAVLRGPDHIFELTNAAYDTLVGRSDLIGRSVREALPEVEGQGFFELLDQVFTTGQAQVGHGVKLRLHSHPTTEPVTVYVDFVYQPIRDAAGAVSGIFVQGHDLMHRLKSPVQHDA